jgi:Tfp pilus assembly pilus retraction ATPase PilT
VRVRLRIDGELMPCLELPPRLRFAVVARLKIMAELDISEHRKPQDGKISFARFGGPKVELRVVTVPTHNGLEDVVLRILSGLRPMPLDDIGLAGPNLALLRQTIVKPYGLILICGPTGCGKTTTLHSVMRELNTDQRKIWTAEDPVEIVQEGLRQVQMNPRIGWTFAAAMRTFLRADPDVIMIGEMRDEETARIAVEASLTGHLVLSTLHTNSAPESITRLLEIGLDPFMFSDSLLAILAQRLVRRLCLHCRVAEPMSPEALAALARDHVASGGAKGDDADTLVAQWRATYGGADGRVRLRGAARAARAATTRATAAAGPARADARRRGGARRHPPPRAGGRAAGAGAARRHAHAAPGRHREDAARPDRPARGRGRHQPMTARPRDEAFRLAHDQPDPQPGHGRAEHSPQALLERSLPAHGRVSLAVLAGIGERLAPASRSCSATAPTCGRLARLEAWGLQLQELAQVVGRAPQLRHERVDLGLALLQTLAEWSGRSRPLRCRTAWPGLQCRRAGQPRGAEAPAGPAGRTRAATGPQRAAGHRVRPAPGLCPRGRARRRRAGVGQPGCATRWPGSCWLLLARGADVLAARAAGRAGGERLVLPLPRGAG